MKLQDAILSIGKKSPFYHYILMGMKFIPDKKIRNLKLSFSKEGDLVLYYNEEKLEKKDIRMIEALLIHEIMHIINQHFLIRPKDNRDKKIWDLAMDASINQYIPELDAFGVPLNVLVEEGHGTDNDVIFAVPPAWMIGESAEVYHAWMIEEFEKKGRFDVEIVSDLREEVDSHEGLYDSDMPIEMILELTKDKIGKAFNIYESEIPSGVKRNVEILLKRPILNWKTILRRFVGVSVIGERYTTPFRPNRRYDHLPGWKNEYLPNIAVILDTSGSIIEEEISEFLSEVEKIAKVLETDFWLVQVDKSVQMVMKYRKGDWKDFEIIGGGETDLQPAVNYVESKLKVEGKIIFTDGHVDLPMVKRRVLFVLSKFHNKDFVEEARRVYGRGSVVILK